MQILISTFAVALALAFTGPASAGDVTAAKTEADCQKAAGVWDAKMKSCSKPEPQGDQEIEKELQQENE